MSKYIWSTHVFRYLTNSKPQLANLRSFSNTPALFAEPPRKKRRLDPAVLKVRVERKIKKHEREIARLEAEPRQAIPIHEYQLTTSEIRELMSRPQHTMQELGITSKSIRGAQRLWSLYRNEQTKMASKSIRQIVRAQENALEQLRKMDEDLYDRTVTIDDTVLIPYRPDHMRKETPPNPEYTPPDGHIKDITKEYVM